MASMRSRRGVSGRFPILRYQIRTVFWWPLLAGVAAMYFFAVIPQSREVYIGIIEARAIFQGLLGLALVGLLCGLLDSWQVMLGSAAIDRMYLEHADIYIDKRLLRLRDILARASAYFPLVGLGAGLFIVLKDTRAAGITFDDELERIAGAEWRDVFPEFADTTESLHWFPVVVAVGLGIVLAILYLSRRYRQWMRERPDRHLFSFSPRTFIVWAGIVVTVSAIVVPLLARDYVVGVTQAVGPLASAAIAMIALVTILMGLSYLSSRLRWPIMGGFVLLLLLWMVWKTTEALTPMSELVAQSTTRPQQAHNTAELTGAFDRWLDERRKANGKPFEQAKVRYPVFIISAQGGGIYAAAASSAFLASMQDRCPHFAQHVFAISAVSGGAVGSALFAASVPPTLVETARCGEFNRLARDDTMSVHTRAIVRKDHLSPALALVWPDIARKLIPKLILAPDTSFDRSSVLERSFACAYESAFADPSQTKEWSFRCPAANGETAGLRMPYEKHWNVERATPALIMAGTWAETGLRTAFAPFPLHAVGDGTINSLHRSATGDFALQGVTFDDEDMKRSLIEAAFVSARFPGIVPAWQARASFANGDDKTWNFVDGGYVDNSGASTALDLYKALKKHIEAGSLEVDLYLVMLTDAKTSPDLNDVEDGTDFSDLVAPISALLNVRGQLAYRAVTRAIGEVEPGGVTADQLAGRSGDSKVLAVNLQQETFKLPLGWKISRITDDIVRLMLGRPALCKKAAAESMGPGDIRGVIGDNSCVKARLEDLLQAKPGT